MTDYPLYTIYPKFVCPKCLSTGGDLTYDGFFLLPGKVAYPAKFAAEYIKVTEKTPPLKEQMVAYEERMKKWNESLPKSEVVPEGAPPGSRGMPNIEWYQAMLAAPENWLVCAWCGSTKHTVPKLEALDEVEEMLQMMLLLKIFADGVPMECNNPIHDGPAPVFGGPGFDDDSARHIKGGNVCIKMVCKCGNRFLVSKEAL